jgi:hypothetical protein
MKIGFAICSVLFMLTFSCKKSNNQINTPPITDTTKPPVVNFDTSALLKSMREYGYSGSIIVDSELMQWSYDDQRRVTLKTYAYFNSNDTTRYTYLNDRYTETFDGYTKGSLRNITNSVYYLGINNRVDSILSSSIGYGIETGSNFNSANYFYYNQENQEMLEMEFSGAQGARTLEYSSNYFYTGAYLDSGITRLIDPVSGIARSYYVDYYSKGNLTSQVSFTDNVLDGEAKNTYTNIPTGGLYIANTTPYGWPPFSYRMPNLMSESVGDSPPLINTQTYTYTYELDAANRVISMTHSSNGVVDQKYVFTYY